MFLTQEELQQLTGYKKPALQRRWLIDNGYNFDIRADGRPIVSRAHFEARHTPEKRKRPSAFNLAALDSVE